MSFEDMKRNEFRFRKAQSRPRTTTKNMHSLEIYEQMEAIKLGLTDDPRKAVRR
jgi:hypothetical protein